MAIYKHFEGYRESVKQARSQSYDDDLEQQMNFESAKPPNRLTTNIDRGYRMNQITPH